MASRIRKIRGGDGRFWGMMLIVDADANGGEKSFTQGTSIRGPQGRVGIDLLIFSDTIHSLASVPR